MSDIFGYEITASPNVKKIAVDLDKILLKYDGQLMTAEIIAALSLVMIKLVAELPPEEMAKVTSMPLGRFVYMSFMMAECKMTPIDHKVTKES